MLMLELYKICPMNTLGPVQFMVWILAFKIVLGLYQNGTHTLDLFHVVFDDILSTASHLCRGTVPLLWESLVENNPIPPGSLVPGTWELPQDAPAVDVTQEPSDQTI
eukprot:4418863-Ditylum_brightwellii.AAC.1